MADLIEWEDAEPYQVYDVVDPGTGKTVWPIIFLFSAPEDFRYRGPSGGWRVSRGGQVWLRYRDGKGWIIDSFGNPDHVYRLRKWEGGGQWP